MLVYIVGSGPSLVGSFPDFIYYYPSAVIYETRLPNLCTYSAFQFSAENASQKTRRLRIAEAGPQRHCHTCDYLVYKVILHLGFPECKPYIEWC